MSKTMSAMPLKSKFSSTEYVAELLVRFSVPDFQNCPNNVLDEAQKIILNSTKNDIRVMEEISNRDFKTRYHFSATRGSRHPTYGFYTEDILAIIDSFLTQKVDGIYLRDLSSRKKTILEDGQEVSVSVLSESLTTSSVTAINAFLASIDKFIVAALYSRKDTVLTEDNIDSVKKIIDDFAGSVSLKPNGVVDVQSLSWCLFSRILGLYNSNFLGAFSAAYDMYSSSTTTKIQFDEVIDSSNYVDFLTKCRLADNADVLFGKLSEFVLKADHSWITVQPDDKNTGRSGGMIVDSNYDEEFFKKCLSVFSDEYVKKAHDDTEFVIHLNLLKEYINTKVKYLIFKGEEVSQRDRYIFTMVNLNCGTLKLESKTEIISEEIVAPYEIEAWLKKNEDMEAFLNDVASMLDRFAQDWKSSLLTNYELSECVVNGRHLILSMNHRPINPSVYEILKYNSSKRGSNGRETICFFERKKLERDLMVTNLDQLLDSTVVDSGAEGETSTSKRKYRRFLSFGSKTPTFGGTSSADGGYGVMINNVERSALLKAARLNGVYFLYQVSKVGDSQKVSISMACELYTIKPPTLGDDFLAFGTLNQRRQTAGEVFKPCPVNEESNLVDIIFSFPSRNATPSDYSDLKNLYLSKFAKLEEISADLRTYKPYNQSKATMPNEATSYADYCNPQRTVAKVKSQIIKFILPSGIPVADLLKAKSLPCSIRLPAYISKEFIIPDTQMSDYAKKFFENAQLYQGSLLSKGRYGLEVRKLSGDKAKKIADKTKFASTQFYAVTITLSTRNDLVTFRQPEFASENATTGLFPLNYEYGDIAEAVNSKSIVLTKDGSIISPREIFVGKKPISFKHDPTSSAVATAMDELCSTLANYIVVHDAAFKDLFKEFVTDKSEKDFCNNMLELQDLISKSYAEEQTLTSLGYPCSITVGDLIDELSSFDSTKKKYKTSTKIDGQVKEGIRYLTDSEVKALTTEGFTVEEIKQTTTDVCCRLLEQLGHEGLSQFVTFNISPVAPISYCYLPKWDDFFGEINHYLPMPTVVEDVHLPEMSDFVTDTQVTSFIKESFKSLINSKVDFKEEEKKDKDKEKIPKSSESNKED